MHKKMRWLALMATLAVMVLIFVLSAQDGTTSEALSDVVMDQVQGAGLQAAIPGWFNPNAYANVRKWAHIYIYCVLGICMAATFCLWFAKRSTQFQAVGAVGACFVYAASDEIHQYFVPGRAMLLGDVFVDAVGFVPGIVLTCLLFWRWRRRRKK